MSTESEGVREGGPRLPLPGLLADEVDGGELGIDLLEAVDGRDEAMLDRVPSEIPTYLTAAAAPPAATAARKFCSVCGFESKYNCARCGMKFCSRKCNAVHTETRCLKFTA